MKWVAGCSLLVVGVALWIRLGPIPPEVVDQTRFASVTVVDRHGIVLYEPLAKSGTRGAHLSASDLPENVVRATLAAEDRRFYRHVGVDPLAIARAVVHDIKARAIVEGGSTITQQTAKLLLQSSSRSILQKARETVLALRLEQRDSKADILAMYLSLAPYGNRISGIRRASRTYFGCDPQQLTLAQAAYLAAIPRRPSEVNNAKARQQRILQALNADEHDRTERLQFAKTPEPVLAQHFVERILKSRIPNAESRIPTSLDANLQRDVAGIIAANRDRLLRHGAHSVAVAVLDNRTGEWLAWEGSGDYFGESFGGAIDGVVTPRQPGSALKPFTYALAFEEGFSPATVLADVPSAFPTAEDGVVYEPRNYDGQYRGPLRVRNALAGSENVPAVAMLSKVGPAALLRVLRGAGITDLTKNADFYGLGLTLGDAEVRLDQLIRAYATFPRGGVTLDGRRLFSQRTAFWISDILSDPDAREFIFGSGGSLDFPFRVAVKTGTSQAYRDNWTVGFTRDLTVGVWVGNFDRRELRNSSGVTGAAPIFHSVMLAALKRTRGSLPIGDDAPIVAPPDDVALLPICGVSGLRPSTYCPSVEKEWLPTSAPAQFCSWHHDGYTDWPSEYRDWAPSPAASQHPLPRRGRGQGEGLRITNPQAGATYLIDPTLRSSSQKLRFRATAEVTWHVDGKRVDSEWPLAPGRHTIAAIDARGNRDAVKIFVK
ncbi:MAG TPA: penicillin-binding protein 1C [Thermoanaerobaculia bacterium]|nr:penicillin-binding protein 1C [Thermoanaerobaculia bacterium]